MSTIRWGVLGAASIARTRTLPAMHKAPSVELVALASRSMDKSTAACAELGRSSEARSDCALAACTASLAGIVVLGQDEGSLPHLPLQLLGQLPHDRDLGR
jgi:predicted dehydrogenase